MVREMKLIRCAPLLVSFFIQWLVGCCLFPFACSQALISNLKDQEPELGEVNDNLSNLMKKVDEKTPNATQVRTNVSQAEQKNKELIDKLNAYKINLEEDVRHARVFQDSLAEIEAWLPLAADYISAQQPISTDSETVRKQLQEAQVCLFLNIMLFKKTPKN